MSPSRVTISVVSHEHFDEIPNLLKDLATHAHEIVHEVIVTLNVPEPELINWIKAHNWPFQISLIRNVKPLGYGTNHNQAFDRCRTPFFCVLNPDVRLLKDPFPVMIDALEAASAGCVYPMQSDSKGLISDLSREIPSPLALLRRYSIFKIWKQPQVRHWINGAFMLFPSSVFSEIGKFDPAYYMYCEDVEICLRLQLRGYLLLPVASAQIRHLAQHASRRRIRHLVWHLQSLWTLWHSESYWQFKLRQRSFRKDAM